MAHYFCTSGFQAPAWKPIITAFPSWAVCVKTDEMIDIFSTPSNSPYLGGESISVRDGGRYNLKKPFSHKLGLGNEDKCERSEI